MCGPLLSKCNGTLIVTAPQSSVSRGVKEEKKLDQVRKEADLGPVSGTSSLVPVCDSQANPLVKEGDGLMFSLTSIWIH